MEAKDLLDLELQAKLEKKVENFRVSKMVDREGRIKKKEKETAEKTGGESNFAKLNQIGHQFISLDYGRTEFED